MGDGKEEEEIAELKEDPEKTPEEVRDQTLVSERDGTI